MNIDRTTKQKFYNSKQWIDMRNYKLSINPLCECEECKKDNLLTPATEVHHIIDIDDDWMKRLDINNLQSLSHSCHSRITMRKINQLRKEGQTKRRKNKPKPDKTLEKIKNALNIN